MPIDINAIQGAPAGSSAGAEVDPLAMPADAIDTRFPRLQPNRLLRMTVRSPERKVSEKGTEMFVFKLETTTAEIDTDGHPLHPGFRFTHRIIGASGERTIEDFKKEFAHFLKCVGKSNIPMRDVLNGPSVVDGLPIDVKIGIQKEKDGFPESNTARFVLPS